VEGAILCISEAFYHPLSTIFYSRRALLPGGML
jgi:hypothetical protein